MTLDNDKARELFNAARNLPSAEREPFLDKECGEDDALRVEVEALLKHHDFTSANTEDSGGFTVDYEPGDMIGKFKIIGVLGEGGMGIVYLAEQSKPVRRRVALKVIKAGMDTKQVIARFEAERQALAMMNHPGIAQVYEAGATEEGRPYFVLEFVKGMPITDACDEHKLNTKERLELLAKVCDAVQHAHQKGIIHRDLKPSNILVSVGENDVLEPKIIDFGVAKATNQQLTDKTLVTQVGRFIGTPAYMSPEQADLKATDIDTRTDVYALGVVTYEVLTGFPPFDPKTLRDAGLEKMREIIRTQPPPKPSTKLSSLVADDATEIAHARQTQIAALAGLLRKELEWIPLKALKKLRSERYDSAKSMGDDIRRYLAGEPLKAGPESTLYRFKKTLRKHKGPFITAAIVSFVLIGGIIGTSTGWRSARQQASEAKEAREQADAATVVAVLAHDEALESEQQALLAQQRLLIINKELGGLKTTLLNIYSPNLQKDSLWIGTPLGRDIPLDERYSRAMELLSGGERSDFRIAPDFRIDRDSEEHHKLGPVMQSLLRIIIISNELEILDTADVVKQSVLASDIENLHKILLEADYGDELTQVLYKYQWEFDRELLRNLSATALFALQIEDIVLAQEIVSSYFSIVKRMGPPSEEELTVRPASGAADSEWRRHRSLQLLTVLKHPQVVKNNGTLDQYIQLMRYIKDEAVALGLPEEQEVFFDLVCADGIKSRGFKEDAYRYLVEDVFEIEFEHLSTYLFEEDVLRKRFPAESSALAMANNSMPMEIMFIYTLLECSKTQLQFEFAKKIVGEIDDPNLSQLLEGMVMVVASQHLKSDASLDFIYGSFLHTFLDPQGGRLNPFALPSLIPPGPHSPLSAKLGVITNLLNAGNRFVNENDFRSGVFFDTAGLMCSMQKSLVEDESSEAKAWEEATKIFFKLGLYSFVNFDGHENIEFDDRWIHEKAPAMRDLFNRMGSKEEVLHVIEHVISEGLTSLVNKWKGGHNISSWTISSVLETCYMFGFDTLIDDIGRQILRLMEAYPTNEAFIATYYRWCILFKSTEQLELEERSLRLAFPDPNVISIDKLKQRVFSYGMPITDEEIRTRLERFVEILKIQNKQEAAAKRQKQLIAILSSPLEVGDALAKDAE